MNPKCFFRGCDHKMKTSIAKRKTDGNQVMKPSDGNQVMKPSDGNQHRKKKLPLLIAKAINSLPHKSFCFCSPMQNRWKPRSENQDLETSIAINSLPPKTDGNHAI